MDSEAKGLLGRPVRDYRYVNSQTVEDAWPAPNAEQCLARAQRAAVISVLDAVWAFTQMKVSDNTSKLLALVSRRGLLLPLVLNFGAKQGPSAFQNMMDRTFGRLRDDDGEEFHAIFIDDVNISTEGYSGDSDDDIVERHIRHCELFLTAARKRNVQFKLTKCMWAQTRVKLLGFILGNGQRWVDPSKAAQLRSWPDPKSLDDIHSFRAFAQYIKEYIP